MATFNVDSLDFSDDETARFGAGPDFDLGFDSGNTRLELTDLVNSTTAYVQQNRAGDLVDGRLAQTVAEGKALADDGVVYDTIQAAENAASSWVKAGVGAFDESVLVDTSGLTLVGSGSQTVISGDSSHAIHVQASDVTVAHLSVKTAFGSGSSARGIEVDSTGCTVQGVRVLDTDDFGINLDAQDCTVTDCVVEAAGSVAIRVPLRDCIIVFNQMLSGCRSNGVGAGGDNTIITGNQIIGCGLNGVAASSSNDQIILANRIHNVGKDGILNSGVDCIIANNRVSDSASIDISDSGTGTVLDANITGSAN